MTLEAGISEKDKEMLWEAENYQNQLQDLIKIKNKLQRELEKTNNELLEVKNSINQNQEMADKIQLLVKKSKILEIENNELREERNE